MMKMLEGKNAIITGANRGIGNAIVKKFAENGCNIWACCRKQNTTFEEEMKTLAEQHQVNIWPVYFELSNEEEIKTGFKQVYSSRLPIDILVNAAGIVNADLFQLTSMHTMREVFDVDFFAPVQLSQLVLRVMTRKKAGSIINLSSIAGSDANPTNCTYGSAKAAVSSFTRILASEVGQYGIRVNAIAPGPTNTEMIATVKDKVGEALLDRCAMNRLANPSEIADVALFLASEQSSFVNGQIIRVDGGAK